MENSNQKFTYQMSKSEAQNIKPMENNCHISDFVQAFP